jgi:hypothetical protein
LGRRKEDLLVVPLWHWTDFGLLLGRAGGVGTALGWVPEVGLFDAGAGTDASSPLGATVLVTLVGTGRAADVVVERSSAG